MEHDKVSRANPALVICLVDCSKSMKKSGARSHAFAAITALRKHARGKREQVRLVVLGFANSIYRGFDGWCENVIDLKLGEGEQTHLKMACDEAVVMYRSHVSQRCKNDAPLTNVLLFSDGGHSQGLDFDDAPGGRVQNLFFDHHPNHFIEPIADLSNVLLGVIDYSGELPQFPLPGTKMTRYKVTCASVLDKSLLEKAYARDLTNPQPPGQSLLEVFGDLDELKGKLFIVSSQNILQSPQSTSAFVRLGTASTFGGTFGGVDTGGGGAPPMPPDDTDFSSRSIGSGVE